MENNIIIRRTKKAEFRTVENVVREAFWNVYRPGCSEHFVLHHLRLDQDYLPELDLVIEKDGEIIGQNIFMKAVITADDGRIIPVMAMGPICILPNLKGQGYGKILLDNSLELAKSMDIGAVCLEGNLNFYGKSGFTYASNYGIRYHGIPEGEDTSFFLLKELIPGYLNGITGEYNTPKAYFVREEDVEAFDKTFPQKIKLKLPGQLFN